MKNSRYTQQRWNLRRYTFRSKAACYFNPFNRYPSWLFSYTSRQARGRLFSQMFPLLSIYTFFFVFPPRGASRLFRFPTIARIRGWQIVTVYRLCKRCKWRINVYILYMQCCIRDLVFFLSNSHNKVITWRWVPHGAVVYISVDCHELELSVGHPIVSQLITEHREISLMLHGEYPLWARRWNITYDLHTKAIQCSGCPLKVISEMSVTVYYSEFSLQIKRSRVMEKQLREGRCEYWNFWIFLKY